MKKQICRYVNHEIGELMGRLAKWMAFILYALYLLGTLPLNANAGDAAYGSAPKLKPARAASAPRDRESYSR